MPGPHAGQPVCRRRVGDALHPERADQPHLHHAGRASRGMDGKRRRATLMTASSVLLPATAAATEDRSCADATLAAITRRLVQWLPEGFVLVSAGADTRL